MEAVPSFRIPQSSTNHAASTRQLDAVFGAPSRVEGGLERIQLLQRCHPFGMVTTYQPNRCPLKDKRIPVERVFVCVWLVRTAILNERHQKPFLHCGRDRQEHAGRRE